jgi:hypothetical protein|tara:strand:+ start:4938 stop:5162 length:225 start_codon:yes stop_codon:yes gene_type:complete
VSSHILDLHGVKHHEVDLIVENFIYLKQEEIPLTIICGNSGKMINLVKDVLERSKSDYREGSGNEYGQIKVYKL